MSNQDEIRKKVLANFHLHRLIVPRLEMWKSQWETPSRKRIAKWWAFQIYVSLHEIGRF